MTLFKSHFLKAEFVCAALVGACYYLALSTYASSEFIQMISNAYWAFLSKFDLQLARIGVWAALFIGLYFDVFVTTQAVCAIYSLLWRTFVFVPNEK